MGKVKVKSKKSKKKEKITKLTVRINNASNREPRLGISCNYVFLSMFFDVSQKFDFFSSGFKFWREAGSAADF